MLLVMCAGIAALITGDVGGAVAIELAGEAGIEAASTEGLGTVPAYYRWLFSIRHPLVWGALAGTFLGALVLFGLIAILITPGEMRTAEILAQAQTNIEQIYSDTGDYPPANGRGGIDLAGVEVLDGFGRPVKYTFSGKWKLKSYTLTSLGYDGTSGGDDLEVSGSMKLARFVKAFKSGTDGVNEMYEIINEMKKKK
ncbi:MAG TPA: hypothetical protein VEJ63_19815 [Planctomycetota bacterium]|nr:hypothetical protein [Planctomycetota bacterium]